MSDETKIEERQRLNAETEPFGEETARLLGKLGSSDPAVRAHVALLLAAQGQAATESLRLALRVGNESVRRGAADILKTLSPETLLAVLDDSDFNVRNAASEALVRRGASGVPLLLTALAAPATDTACIAILDVLGRIGDARAVPPVTAKLHHRNGEVRLAAARGLAQMGPLALPMLRLLLAIGDSAMRRVVAGTLARHRDPDNLSALLLALSDPDEEVRLTIVGGLATFGPPALDTLLDSLTDASAPVRARAARALDRVTDRRAILALLNALSDSDATVQAAARDALGGLQHVTDLEPLVFALVSPDRRLSGIAAGAIRAIGIPAVPALIGAMRMRPAAVAARLLGQLRDARAVPVLADALANSDLGIQIAVVEALSEFRDETTVSALLNASQQTIPPSQQAPSQAERDTLRAAIYTALGKIGGEQVVPALIAALSELGESPRKAAADALVRVGHPAVDTLINALSAPNLLIRLHALRVLGRIGDPEALHPLVARLRDTDATIQREAAQQLYVFAKIEYVGEFLALINSPDTRTRYAAATLLNDIGDWHCLPRHILAYTGFTALQKFELLQQMKSPAYEDVMPILRYNIRDPLIFCRKIITDNAPGEDKKAVQAGAEAVVAHFELVRGGQKGGAASELLRSANGDGPETLPESLPRPSQPPAGAAPEIGADAPRKSGPLDRWFRRAHNADG